MILRVNTMHSEKLPNDTIAYRLRTDLQWMEVQGKKRDWWIATDPLRSQHFRCSPEERELLKLLDTSRSICEWRQSYLCKNKGKSIRTEDLQRLLTRFLEYGFLRPQLDQSQLSHSELSLLQPTVAPKKTAISLPQKAISFIQWVEQFPWRLIQSRWSLGNPQRFLQSISGHFDLLYDPRAVTAWLYGFVVVSALVLLRLAADADPLAWHPTRWTAITPWMQFGNCVAILMITRIFHEMGHAIVATRLGAKVREVGIFWVLGVACPYVDVSDAWRLPSQSKRIFVSLAGIYTEVILATIAAIVWLNTAPGFVNTTCWQTMIVCSAMTIAININPLVRYDGYFALSDYLEIANLRESSTMALHSMFASSSMHSELKGNTINRRPSIRFSEVGLALFGLASAIYRFVLTFSFSIAAITIGRMWELDSIGLGVAISLVICAFILPIIRGTIVLLSQRSLISFRTVVGYSSLAAITFYAVVIPLPSFVVCDGIVGWSEQKIVYTKEPGRLVSVAPIQLENATLRYQNQSAKEKLTQLQSKVDQARLAMHHDPSAAYPIEKLSLQATIASETQLQIQSQLDSMQILTQPIDQEQKDLDTLVSVDWRPLELPPPEQIDSTLESGLGKTLHNEAGYSVQDESNVGRWLPEGTAIGVFIRGERLRINVTVDEDTLSQIQLGTRARFILAAYPTEVRYGRVVSLSDIASLEISQAFSKPDRRSFATQTTTEVDPSSPSQSFGILIEMEDYFDEPDQTLKLDKTLFGSAASIVLETQAQSVLDRVCRYAERVIR
jgi:putative peptide zinc metalloprotease protein